MDAYVLRKFFPGNNTPQGFFSFFQYIIRREEAKDVLILKGGPGVGKSVFMKGIAGEMLRRGFPVEYHHCASDPDSLDAVAFPAIGVALLDGTAPHVVDPLYPGCVDWIVNLGDYWDEGSLKANRVEIIRHTQSIGRHYAHAYRTLQAAKNIYDDWAAANRAALQGGLVNQKRSFLQELLSPYPVAKSPGRRRCLFATAITASGLVSFLDGLMDPVKDVYVVTGEPGTGKSQLLRTLGEDALQRGFDVEFYQCPLDPVGRVEHLIISELKAAVATSTIYHPYIREGLAGLIDMGNCLDPAQQDRKLIEEDRELFNQLLERSISFLRQAKQAHDQLESYYVPHMDFDGVAALRARVMERILAHADKASARI